MRERLIEILECPVSRTPLNAKPQAYTTLGDIPWFFRHPESMLLQWQARARAALHSLESHISRLEVELLDSSLLPSTQQRLKKLKAGYELNIKTFTEILQPLITTAGTPPASIATAVADKVPVTQILESYFDNIFRDWAWENGENIEQLECLKAVGAPAQWGQAAVIGSGGSRLAYDILQWFQPVLLVALDINPLLLLTAQKLCRGESLTLCEFPLNPLQMDEVVVEQRCQAPHPATEALQFLFADGMNLPFKAKALDQIVTPWFIDIIPQDLNELARKINRSLKTNGQWFNFGPLGFQHTMNSKCYSVQEVEEILKSSGFKVAHSEQRRVRYLQSPHGGHWRTENVFCFQAVKVSEAKEPKFYQYLPHWLMDHSQPIPMSQELATAMMNHRIYAEVLSAIDGKRSLHQIADLMVQHYKMEHSMALESLSAFLTAQYERAIYRRR